MEDKSPVGRFRRLVRAIIVQNRWTRFASKMADNDQMVKVKEMSHSSNQDVLTFNPGGKLRFHLSGSSKVFDRWFISADSRNGTAGFFYADP